MAWTVLLCLVFLVAAAVVSWNILAPRLSLRHDRTAPRNAGTGILKGAEPLRLGPDDAPNAVLFVHGFSGTPNNFKDLPMLAAQAGWHARAMLLPGHGTSPLDFDQTSPDELEAAVDREVKDLLGGHRRVVLVGHSMGGALAALCSAKNPDVAGLVLAAPYFGITRRWWLGLTSETWINSLGRLVVWVYSPPGHQPVRRPGVSRLILSYPWITTRSGRNAMEVARRAGSTGVVGKITQPVLLIHSKLDGITSPEMARAVLDRFPSQQKHHVELTDSDHMIFWDNEEEVVNREVLDFLKTIEKAPLNH